MCTNNTKVIYSTNSTLNKGFLEVNTIHKGKCTHYDYASNIKVYKDLFKDITYISITEKTNIFKDKNILMKKNNDKSNISYISNNNIICDSPNIIKKSDKLCNKDIEEKIIEYNNKINPKNILSDITYKSINTKFKNDIINNSIHFRNINNNINFNYNKVSELCKKMNFDFFAEKIN